MTEEVAAQVAKAAKKYLILFNWLTPTVYTSVADCGVLLTIRHLCDPRQRRGVSQAIWEDILAAFARRPDIDFAFSTQRFFDHLTEEKAAAAGPNDPVRG